MMVGSTYRTLYEVPWSRSKCKYLPTRSYSIRKAEPNLRDPTNHVRMIVRQSIVDPRKFDVVEM